MKPQKGKLTPEFWARNAENMRRLRERIDYHQRKLDEERAARGEPPRTERPDTMQLLQERIAYHERKLAEERGDA
jgi:hypothetical protein